MPNHITTVCALTAAPATIDRFVAAHFKRDDERKADLFFDFNTIVPMPASVATVEESNVAAAGMYALTGIIKTRFIGLWTHPVKGYEHRGFEFNAISTHDDFRAWLEANDPDVLAKGRAMLAAFRETGFFGWYDWSYANWGTKWNSYDLFVRMRGVGQIEFQFDTANGIPEPIFERLAEMYPEAEFALRSIDEGGPQFEGRYCGTERRYEQAEPSPERFKFVYGMTEEQKYGDDDDAKTVN
jgi:hypothetical protein